MSMHRSSSPAPVSSSVDYARIWRRLSRWPSPCTSARERGRSELAAVLIGRYTHFLRGEVRGIGRAEEIRTKRMNLNVPVGLHNSFKSITAAEGENMTDVLLNFIRQYVGKHTITQPKGRRK